ncbi:DUF6873 family GME fold protein [Caproiciproducens sp. MSJ-32]|uniref:DUF6873 family GME fold protein n=1 Tax=Caproiciproducens sp. MSJ-32 TaxID=2841527 RepID=UPI001C0FF7FC|nr:hypothetical protein [Caproiciproducens sp. MSJ-32]MBU5456172.1 hypothetical protein [Caproiciproducens sp. MSJ-32]
MICFIDYRTSEEERNSLKALNLTLIEIPPCNNLYEAINGHVDIQLNIIDKNKKRIIIQKEMPEAFKKMLVKNNISFIESKNSLEYKYPNNIILNSLILDNYFVHNLNFTDPNLLDTQRNKKLINVKQGYTKCSVLVVADKAIITNDKSIYKNLIKENFDILLLPPGDIILEGLDYGFIGGTGGLINKNTMAFFGSLENYLYGEKVKNFLTKYNVKPLYLSNGKLIDRGSLMLL